MLTDEEFWSRYYHLRYTAESSGATGAKLGPKHPLIGQRMYSDADIEAMKLKGRDYHQHIYLHVAAGINEGSKLPLPVELYKRVKPDLEYRWLIKNLVPERGKTVVIGAPGTGKFYLMIDQALHLASLTPWFGRPVNKAGVIYVAAEGQEGVRLRIAAWRAKHPEIEDPSFVLVPKALDLLNPKGDIDKLRQVMEHWNDHWECGVHLLVVDTLAATFGGGDENGPDMARYVANLDRLCAWFGCALVIVHHAPVDEKAKRPRGHNALWGAADTVLYLSGDRNAPARRLHVLKQKDAEPGPDIMFQLEPVKIGIDEDGDPVTSCVVVPADVPPSTVPTRRKLSKRDQTAKDALERTLASTGVVPPDQIPAEVLDREVIDRVVRVSDWRLQAASGLSGSDTKPDTLRRTFDRARDNLQRLEIINVWEDWAWLTR